MSPASYRAAPPRVGSPNTTRLPPQRLIVSPPHHQHTPPIPNSPGPPHRPPTASPQPHDDRHAPAPTPPTNARGPLDDVQGASDLCALGRIRTCNLLIRSQMLYPLSYERLAFRRFFLPVGVAGTTLHDLRREAKSIRHSRSDLRKCVRGGRWRLPGSGGVLDGRVEVRAGAVLFEAARVGGARGLPLAARGLAAPGLTAARRTDAGRAPDGRAPERSVITFAGPGRQ